MLPEADTDRDRRDDDSLWKDIIERFFYPMLQRAIPKLYADADTKTPPRFLDKELKKATYRLKGGKRSVDLLAQSKLAGGASVIGIASMSSYFGIPIVPGYGAAKTGLLGLTRALAVEWGPRNIRVNAVAAGLTESKMTAGTFSQEAWTAPTLQRTPLGRLGVPEDIAQPILFLTSPGAAWVTGQTLPIDGGYTVSG